MKGRIKMFNVDKGYGFIVGDNEKDHFFHISQVKSQDVPEQGQKVDFIAERNEKGLCALGITIQTNSAAKFIVLGNQRVKSTNIKEYGISKMEVYYQKVYRCKSTKRSHSIANILQPPVSLEYNDTGEWHEIDHDRYDFINSYGPAFYRIIKARKGECLGRYYSTYYSEDSRLNVGSDLIAKSDGVYDLNELDIKLTKLNKKNLRSDVKSVVEECLYITTYQGEQYVFAKSNEALDIYSKLKEIDDSLM